MKNNTRLEFFEWISTKGIQLDIATNYLYEYISFLNQNDFSIIRSIFGGSSLHPEVEALGYSYTSNYLIKTPSNVSDSPYVVSQTNFLYSEGLIVYSRFKTGLTMSDPFKESPIPALWKNKKEIYIPIWKEEKDSYPIIQDLREEGATGYFAMPLISFQGIQTFASFSTSREEGFTDSMIADLKGMTEIFSLGWHRFLLKETMHSLLSLYLGPMTAPKVLSGKIRRGDVEELEAIIWFSDIRGYSSLSSQSEPNQLIEWLNEYYETQIKNIHRYGGEVLKIMGDGILAVFPTTKRNKMKTIARRALLAADKSLSILKSINSANESKRQPPIQHGIALHHGVVKYGNIGSNDRLDFTIIGNDVNLTARISSICGQYQKEILMSEEMVELLPGRTEVVARDVELKGIKNKQVLVTSKEIKKD